MANKYKKNQRTFLEVLVIGLLKAIWWLIKLPFKKRMSSSGQFTQNDRNQIVKQRLEIEKFLGSQSIIEQKHALFEADKLVDHILQLKGYNGETFADRLRSAENDIDPNLYQAMWQGHKVRNQIAHETGTEVDSDEIKSSIFKLLRYIKNV